MPVNFEIISIFILKGIIEFQNDNTYDLWLVKNHCSVLYSLLLVIQLHQAPRKKNGTTSISVKIIRITYTFQIYTLCVLSCEHAHRLQ